MEWKPEQIFWMWLFINFGALLLAVATLIGCWFTNYTSPPSQMSDKTTWLILIFWELFVTVLSVGYSYMVEYLD